MHKHIMFNALSLLFIVSTAASQGSIRRVDDLSTDAVDTTSRNLLTHEEHFRINTRSSKSDCVARSSYLGCYKNKNQNRALPYEVGRGYSANECETACTEEGYVHFAREWKGQCFCSNGSDYDKHGSTTDCDCCGDNVGENKMCVWMAGPAAPGCDGSGAPAAPYLGCYNDKNMKRALPYEVSGRGHSAKDCQDECADKGMKYFAREWKGQCFCSEDDDFGKHGTASDCDCCGNNVGLKKMCVWVVA